MQVAHRTFDENGVGQVNEPNEKEKAKIIDNLWFEKRDVSTQDAKTQNATFHKEQLALFRKSEVIKQTRTDNTVFPVTTIAVDSQPNMVSFTLMLLAVLARKIAQENRANREHSYQSWHEVLQETLAQLSERHQIQFRFSCTTFLCFGYQRWFSVKVA